MIRGPLPSECLAEYCSEDRSLLDFYDTALRTRRWVGAVLQIGGHKNRVKGWKDYFADSTIIFITPDPTALLYEKRIASLYINPTDNLFRLFCLEYQRYFGFICCTHPVTESVADLLKKTLIADGLLVRETNPLTSYTRDV